MLSKYAPRLNSCIADYPLLCLQVSAPQPSFSSNPFTLQTSSQSAPSQATPNLGETNFDPRPYPRRPFHCNELNWACVFLDYNVLPVAGGSQPLSGFGGLSFGGSSQQQSSAFATASSSSMDATPTGLASGGLASGACPTHRSIIIISCFTCHDEP